MHKEAEQRLGRDSGGLIRIGAPDYFDFHILSSLLGQFSARYPAVRLQVELGIGPDISALLDEGELDIAIVSSEIGEGDGVPLCREPRVWAAGRAMQLDPEQPAPLALYPPHCRWRQLALEQLDRAGRAWTVVLQSAGTAGILAALDAGLGITIFPEHGLPNTLKSLGSAEALPALPDFEFVLRRSRKGSPAADHLADMIINFFQLSAALRPGSGMQYQEGSNFLSDWPRGYIGPDRQEDGLTRASRPMLIHGAVVRIVRTRFAGLEREPSGGSTGAPRGSRQNASR